jgi:hypothetical protein
MANCLWNGDRECHRYHLASWQHVTIEKEFGGLGVSSLRELNLYLLGSWVRRYCLDEGKLWRQIIDFKYDTCKSNVFTCVERRPLISGRGSCGQPR